MEKAKFYFEKAGLPAQWVERPHQGRTLQVADALGAPLEFCATMARQPRLVVSFKDHHGAVPQRIDHFQLLVPDVQRALEFYMALGFRLSEYIAADGGRASRCSCSCSARAIRTTSCSRPAPGRGCITPRSAFRNPICSFTSAISPRNMGFAENVEFGPGRHGPGHALFVYLRDPDGHRIELFNTHYQCMDIDDEPVRWDASHAGARHWQLPARAQWFTQASRFAGLEPREPARKGSPMTLERYVGAKQLPCAAEQKRGLADHVLAK